MNPGQNHQMKINISASKPWLGHLTGRDLGKGGLYVIQTGNLIISLQAVNCSNLNRQVDIYARHKIIYAAWVLKNVDY